MEAKQQSLPPQTLTKASGLVWYLQTSFKRAAPTSAPDSGGNGCPEAAEVIDWDSVKPDDKTLVFQVSLLQTPRHPPAYKSQSEADTGFALSFPGAFHQYPFVLLCARLPCYTPHV